MSIGANLHHLAQWAETAVKALAREVGRFPAARPAGRRGGDPIRGPGYLALAGGFAPRAGPPSGASRTPVLRFCRPLADASFGAAQGQPKVKQYASTPASRNSTSKRRSAKAPGWLLTIPLPSGSTSFP